jgi:hypothetical protein
MSGATIAQIHVVHRGKRILWFCKFGAKADKAEVSVDGGPAEVVDTYAATTSGASAYSARSHVPYQLTEKRGTTP